MKTPAHAEAFHAEILRLFPPGCSAGKGRLVPLLDLVPNILFFLRVVCFAITGAHIYLAQKKTKNKTKILYLWDISRGRIHRGLIKKPMAQVLWPSNVSGSAPGLLSDQHPDL